MVGATKKFILFKILFFLQSLFICEDKFYFKGYLYFF